MLREKNKENQCCFFFLLIIDTNWSRASSVLNIKLLRETILTFHVTNEELGKAKKKEEHLNACVKECKVSYFIKSKI